jgi:hypothetical protein
MVAKWILVGNRCSWEFFEFHKGHKPFSMIKELMDGGQTIIEEEDIKQHVQSFYHMYTKVHYMQARVQCFKSVPIIVMKEDQNKFLLQEFLDIEVCKAIRDLPKHKTLGINGIPMEFKIMICGK